MLRIHSYETMGTTDGPGLRLVVFVQGCPLRCLYCANPDTISAEGGKLVDIQEIVRMAESQRSFFGKKGGVTISGGEPTMQAAELIPLFRELRSRNINTCLDTNGAIWNSAVEELFHLTDLVLLDIKHIDTAKHLRLTGANNSQPLKTARWLEDHNRPFWLRHVVVPSITCDPYYLHQLAQHFTDYKQIKRIELLPYHTLGVHKYEALGLDYPLKDIPQITPEEIQNVRKIFGLYFKNISFATE